MDLNIIKNSVKIGDKICFLSCVVNQSIIFFRDKKDNEYNIPIDQCYVDHNKWLAVNIVNRGNFESDIEIGGIGLKISVFNKDMKCDIKSSIGWLVDGI